jgi:hypothetical protein
MFVKAALRQGLSEVEMPPKAAPKSTPKQLHFHSYIDIRRDKVNNSNKVILASTYIKGNAKK